MNNYNLKAEQNLLEMKKQKEKSDKKMTKVKIIGLFVLAIFIVFMILTVRKMLIISDLSDKADAIINTNNYHKTQYVYRSGNYTKVEYFKLGNKMKMIYTNVDEDNFKTVAIYANESDIDEFGNKSYIANVYTTTMDSKTLTKNLTVGISVDPQNTMQTVNRLHLFVSSILASVKKTTYDGVECYYINNFKALNSTEEGMYIEKETGLLIATEATETKYAGTDLIGRGALAEAEYEFNTVTEENFIEPEDASEYKQFVEGI